VLVTGLPRSGTTWLARLLATAPHTALCGREPMNPRDRQYALGGTLDGWARLEDPTPRQRRLLRLTYAGWNPRTYGRYGRHQSRAPLPRTRVVVKDPFALLSTPAIASVTGATPVVVYRHPGAVLASFRRVGWQPDLAGVEPWIEEAARHDAAVDAARRAATAQESDVRGMVAYWLAMHRFALDDLDTVPGAVLVSHARLAGGGVEAAERLFARLGLTPTDETRAEMSGRGAGDASAPAPDATSLHRLDRSPGEVAEAWRGQLDAGEVEEIEELAAPMLAELEARRLG
jgi:hypothetical protein